MHHSTNQKLYPAGQEKSAHRIMEEPHSMQILGETCGRRLGERAIKFLVIEITTKRETTELSKIYLHIHTNISTLESHLTREGSNNEVFKFTSYLLTFSKMLGILCNLNVKN